MGYRKVPLVGGEFFHVYNRGNSKQKIFFCDKDYQHFVKLLYLCNSTKPLNFREDIVRAEINPFDWEKGETLVSIAAWVLMPNHFHIYLTSKVFPKDGPLEVKELENKISIFMKKLGTAYSSYINTKYNRTGSLFEGRFKSMHVVKDTHAKYLFSYIHLNPIKIIDSKWKENGISDKKKALQFLKNYRWSSYYDYLGDKRCESRILDREPFPFNFPNSKIFEQEIMEWLTLH